MNLRKAIYNWLVARRDQWEFKLVTDYIEKNIDLPQSYVRRARILLARKQYEQAMSDLEKAAGIGELDYAGLKLRANCCFHLQQFERAATDAHRILEVTPDDFDLIQVYGISLCMQGHAEDAMAYHSRMIAAASPASDSHRIARAFAAYSVGKFADAMEDLTSVSNSSTLKPSDYVMLGDCHAKMGDDKTAKRYYQLAGS